MSVFDWYKHKWVISPVLSFTVPTFHQPLQHYSDTKEGGEVSLLKQSTFDHIFHTLKNHQLDATYLQYRCGQGGEVPLLQLLLDLLLSQAAVGDRD